MGNKPVNSIASYLKIENLTKTNVDRINISNVYRADWQGVSHPRRAFNRLSIVAGGYIKRRLEIRLLGNPHGNGKFTITLYFGNGQVDVFSFCQKFAVGRSGNCFKHIRRSHDIMIDREGSNTTKITIRNTQAQINNERAQKVKQEAGQYAKQKKYAQALQKIEAALKLATDKKIIRELNVDKSSCYFQLAKISMKTGLNLENQKKSNEAKKKFDEAKKYFEIGKKLRIHEQRFQIEINIVNAKINGSKLFNEAVTLNEKALELFKKNQSTRDNNIIAQIKNNYQQALNKYEQANKMFEYGSKIRKEMFTESIQINNIAINDVKQSIQDIISVELNINFTKMHFKDKKPKKNIMNKKYDGVVVINQEVD